jgi:UDP-N-acetylmuramate--alanine ligase
VHHLLRQRHGTGYNPHDDFLTTSIMRWRDFDNLPPLPQTFFDTPRRVHFIGIGGIGMSALAFALRERGHHISGSDARDSAMLAKLREAGVQTVVAQNADNLRVLGEPAEAIIFSSAITANNPERAAATQLNIPQWHRAQLLAYFVNSAKFSIAVSGTHGKSTTSAMVAHILHACGKNPTALLGAEYPPFGSNARIGDPDLVVVEADESDGSFTLLRPTVAVVTNVEPEHLENYDDSEAELWRAFELFASQARSHLVLNADDSNMLAVLSANNHQLISYEVASDSRDSRAAQGLQAHEGLPAPRDRKSLRASSIRVQARSMRFDLQVSEHRGQRHNLGQFCLASPGRHNLSNALAAIGAATATDVNVVQGARTLRDFQGVKRRFQFIGEANDVLVYDDYGHHPTEVASTLQTAREFLEAPVVAVFQPHRYSRTSQMGHLFGPSFEAADRIIITQLYSAFETPIEGVSGRIVLDSVREALPDKPLFFAENLEEARRMVTEVVQPGDAVFCMGAGDITTLPPLILQDLKNS